MDPEAAGDGGRPGAAWIGMEGPAAMGWRMDLNRGGGRNESFFLGVE